MSDLFEPQWDLLPDQPEEFFGLQEDYDLRDLKRRYNSLIRRFKPEKFPQEFQRIRAAFEQLNSALRYQEPPQNRTSKLPYNWNIDQQPDEDPPQSSDSFHPLESPTPEIHNLTSSQGQHSESESPRLLERIFSEPPQDLYEKLEAKTLKTSFDYYALAVFSDILQDKEHTFADWLLYGLQEHPDDPALFELLRTLYATIQSEGQLTKLLETTSQIVRSDRFYYLTEQAWDNLLRTASFDTFRRTLSTCEKNLLSHKVDHLLVFYLHILKSAIWKADNDWVDSTFTKIEELSDRLPTWAEEELEFLFFLRSYILQRSQFLLGGLGRITIDQAIIDYCTKNEIEADRSFLECQQKLIVLEEELLSEFEEPAEELETVQILWEMIAEDVYDRMGTELPEIRDRTLDQNAHRHACQILNQGTGLDYIKVAKVLPLLYSNIILLLGLAALYYITQAEKQLWQFVPIFVTIFLLIYVGRKYDGQKIAENILDWFTVKYYRSCWRIDLLRHYEINSLPQLNQEDELKIPPKFKIGNEIEYDSLEKVATLIREDYGLSLYFTAQRLLTACH